VVIANGRIQSVGQNDAPADAELIDGTGQYLIPGLWDMHVHLRHPVAPRMIMPQFIAHGVTGVRDMSSDCSRQRDGDVCIAELREWRTQIERGDLLGLRMLALSSYALNPPWDAEITEAAAREMIRDFKDRGVDLVKIY
jgi:hypothetical protein